MSNLYSITEADIIDIVANDSAWRNLITDAENGGQIDNPQAVIDSGVKKFAGWGGGAFAESANLSLARPFAVAFALYALHALKASRNPAYQIPETVTKARDEAKAWAKSTGKDLLKAEGGEVAGSPGVCHGATDPRYTMTILNRL